MAPTSRQLAAAAKESILTPVLTLKGHTSLVRSISYCPDGKRMVSGSYDGTIRRWDPEVGKEIEEEWNFDKQEAGLGAVSIARDGRWLVMGGEYFSGWCGVLKVCEVETGIARTYQRHSRRITCIDISMDSMLVASGSFADSTVLIWSLDTGEFVAGPFQSDRWVATVKFSQDSKKLAVVSNCIDVWDVQTQKLDVRGRKSLGTHYELAPVFWTTKDKTIVAAVGSRDSDHASMIYEFDASTLETVGTPFKGHTDSIKCLALSFDCALLASGSLDDTIKLWAFESRQLLASFHVQNPFHIVFSPDSRQLAYTTGCNPDIYLCNTPPGILASIQPADVPPEAMLQDLSKYITKDGDYPVARGGFGEIWKCTYHNDQTLIKVAVKALHVYAADQLGGAKTKKIKRIKHELRICANLKHANILHVYGYTYGFGPFMAIVSPWAENGNLTAYLEREGATLTLVRRFQILRDIIAGLRYLHANNIIHGDFNGPNVLIHGDGSACVADFGLSLMYSEVISASQASWTSTLKGNVRWMAPELLADREDGSQVRPSEQSDMYSFGGIMLQVLTNKIPYYHLSNDAAIVLCIAKSQTPSRSRYPDLRGKYWQLIEKCWSTGPRDRPSTKEVNGMIRIEYYALSRSP